MKFFKSLKLILLLFICSGFTFIACSSDDDDNDDNNIVVNDAGQIPGLGNTDGELTGKAFQLPSGITLEQDITGYDGSYKSAIDKKESNTVEVALNSLPKANIDIDEVIGSGYYVTLLLNLKNGTDKDVEIEFPAGLIIKSRSGDYQNGVLLKKTKATISANQTENIVLLMYCGNASRSSSSSYEKYDWAVISNSSLIVDLCNRLANKKINYEEFASTEVSTYVLQVTHLQDILWKLTDEEGISDEEIQYISKLPDSN